MIYDIIFYWIGVVSSLLFVLIGMSAFAAFVMNKIWCRFKEGKELFHVIAAWNEKYPLKLEDQ